MMNFKRVLLAVLTLLLSASFTIPSSPAQEKAGSVQIDLTAEEKAFLAGKQLRLGVDSSRPPFEFIDEKGVYSGICAGFIEESAKRIGVTVSKVPGLTVSAAIDKVKSGEIDVIPKVTPTPEREKHLLFTPPFVTFPSVIISRKDARFIGGLDDLGGLKIGVLKGLVVEELLKRDYPQLPLIALPDVKSALMDLSTGKIDVFVDNLGTVSYNIEKLGITNLKIAAPTPYNHDLAFGVRKDWPLLASALSKALASMTNQEKTEIKNRWLAIKYDAGINWRVFVPVGAVLLAIIAFVVFWNRSLRRAIRERECVQEQLKDNTRLLELRGEIKEKISRISVDLQQAKEFEDLTRTFMSQVAPLAGAAYGVFYLLDEQRGLLQAVGGYGWMDSETISRQFVIGQGLVGQCAKEKKTLSFNNSRESNIRITWGGGHFAPREILLLPVLERDNVLAVIELGSLQSFTAEQRALLEELMPVVGLNLEINRRNLTTRELLAKSQSQIAELAQSRKAMLNILQDLEAARMEAESTGHKVKAMSEAINDALVMIDGQGKVLFWNQAAEKLFGYTATEVMGKDFHELAVPPEEIEKARAGMRKFAQTGQGILFGSAIETTAINRMGETFSVEVNLSPFQLGNDWFAVGTVRDITERKRADALKVGKEVAEEAAARAEEAAVQAEQARQEAERAQEELKVKLQEIERFNRLSLGRESRIIELKKQVNEIAVKAEGKPIYQEQDITGDNDDLIQAQSLVNGLDQAEIPPQAIAEMLNVDKFQRLLEDFCDSVGIASAIIDLQGRVLASARWQRACTDFHRVNEKTCARCIESDTELALNLSEGKNFSVYRCKNGLTDAASPIIIEGKHIANTFVGQFFTSPPDMDYFRRQAEECGLDADQYLAAIRDVPVVAENKLQPVLGFLVGVAQTVTAMSMERNRAKQAETSITKQIEMINRERTSAMSLAEDANDARTELERYKDNLELLIQERTEALKLAGQEQVAIFESLTLGIAFVKDRVILRGNAKLGELFGRTLDEMVGQTTRIWYSSDEEYSGIGASTYEDLKTKPIHQREQQLPRKDGSLFWCLFRVRALDAQDISQGIVCTLEDITERKQAEKELRERMEELERFSRLTVDRERKMIQLKEEINGLLEKTGGEKKYKIVE